MKKYLSPIQGNLDIAIHEQEDVFDGVVEKWTDVLIHGDPEGLRSFAALLLTLADLDQEIKVDLPIGAKEHIHLNPGVDLSKNSVQVVVGRLDAKSTGLFYDGFIPRHLTK